MGADVATVDDLRAALEARGHKIKRTGGSYQTTCPAHEDKNPSLSFREGDHAELLATCHTGCTFEQILAALDLDQAPSAGSDFEARIEKTYDYVDEDGKLLYQVVRQRAPKDFRQRRPDGDGWTWKLGDVRRVLYRLPDVRAAVQERRAVFVVEGEKDADAIRALGLVATCSPMGASKNEDSTKWRDDYSASLVGVHVAIVVADCDEPGRAHARSACASLHAAGVPSRYLDLDPGRDDGYDVSDLLLEKGPEAKTAVEAIARRAPAWPIEPRPALPTVAWGEFRDGVRPQTTDLDYCGPLLRGGKRVHVLGPIGHGKTTLLVEALGAAVYGREFLGFQGRGGVAGLYVELGDMAPEEIAEAGDSARWASAGTLDIAHLPDGLEIDRNERHRLMLEEACARYQVIVIDPWYKLLGEELSDRMSGVRVVTSFLDGLRERYPGVAIVIGFHANEPQKGQRLSGIGSASGYKVFQRGCDTAVLFERVSGDRSHLTWAKTRSARLPKMGERWLLQWTRGQGFQKVERARATDELLAVMTGDWQGKHELAEAWGRSESFTLATALKLAHEGRVVKRMIGRSAEFRPANADQERIAVD